MCSSDLFPSHDNGQGNTWDTYLETMNDWHKPALDGIGYQDSLNGERAWWTDYIADNKYRDWETGRSETSRPE